jgi:hypothetical protein
MTSGSADQTPSEHGHEAPEPTSHDDAATQPGGGAKRQQPEQLDVYGPLELLRTRKADGRSLLLFSHREEQPGR